MITFVFLLKQLLRFIITIIQIEITFVNHNISLFYPLETIHQNLYLIGMPGVGKSYWAEQIAASYSMHLIDLDSIIEVRTGMGIGAFFEKFGESEFRKLERLTLSQILEVFQKNCVVACGGGTPCFYNNLSEMKKHGKVVYLKASLDYLFQNLTNEIQTRPLLKFVDWKEKLSELLEKRAPVFEQATETILVEAISIKDFVSVL